MFTELCRTCADVAEPSGGEFEFSRPDHLSLGCVGGRFGAADAELARQMCRRRISLAVIESAMLPGACRKYGSWLQGRALEPILSVCYFEALIAEIQTQSLPPGDRGYLRKKVKQFTEMWNESLKSGAGSQR